MMKETEIKSTEEFVDTLLDISEDDLLDFGNNQLITKLDNLYSDIKKAIERISNGDNQMEV